MTPLPPPSSTTRRTTFCMMASACCWLVATSVAAALDPDETDPRKIARAVEQRDDGDKEIAHMVMTLTDDSGRHRTRKLVSRRMDFDEGTKTLMLFESPADLRNTGLLSIDYDDGSKDDDQWLYLPSLRRSTRISTSDKSGSFLGTDITYADMTKTDVDDYDYKLLDKSVEVDGESCWLIESRPRNEETLEETGYVKVQSWISKSKLMPLQVKAWVREGKKLKYIKFGEIKKVSGIWIPHRMAVRTVRKGKVESTTVLEFTKVVLDDPSVTDADFTERRLEKGL